MRKALYVLSSSAITEALAKREEGSEGGMDVFVSRDTAFLISLPAPSDSPFVKPPHNSPTHSEEECNTLIIALRTVQRLIPWVKSKYSAACIACCRNLLSNLCCA